MPAWLDNWLERHQHPISRGIHALAIPLMPLAGVVAGVQLVDGAWSLWWRPAGLLVVSYSLQWIGHRFEGNDMGEIVLIKKILGRPYVAISPRYRRTCDAPTSSPGRATS